MYLSPIRALLLRVAAFALCVLSVAWAQLYQVERYTPADGLPQSQVRAMIQDSRGYLWFGTHRGISRFDGRTFVNYEAGDQPNQLSGSFVSALYEDRSGALWIATDKGVNRFRGKTFERIADTQLPDSIRSVLNALHKLFLTDREGHTWEGTENGVFHTIPEQGRKAIPEIPYPIRSCLRDHEGNLWFGTEGGGVCKVTEGVFTAYTVADGLSSNIVKSFLEDESGIWMVTADKGANRPAGNRFSAFTEANGLGGNDICYSMRDREGRFWFASYSKGVTCLNRGATTRYTTANGLPSNAVFSLAQVGDDQWVGTDQGIGVISPGKETRVLLPGMRVYCMLARSNGEVWIGSATGIYVLRNGVLEEQKPISRNVLTILEDKNNRLWFATANGVKRFDGNSFVTFTPGMQAAANTIVSMAFDKQGNLWLGTELGAYRLDVPALDAGQEPVFEHFDTTDGLPSLECNANAVFCDSKGYIWFGTIEGAVKVNTTISSRSSLSLPIVHLTGIRLPDDRDTLSPNLALSYDNNRLKFEFTGISFRDPAGVQFGFRLEGLDTVWTTTYDRSATYANLAPGEYVFRIRARHEGGEWSQPEAFSFVIKPPFWRTWWFLLLALAVLGLIGWGIYAIIRNRIAQRRREEQLRFRAERLQLEHQALYAMMNPHFTFNALQSIQYYIHKQDRIAANKFLSNFAKLMRKNLDSINSEYITINEEIERLELYLSLEKMRFQDKFEFKITIDDDLRANDLKVPPMILQPYVENSIKHGIMSLEEGGKIEVSISPKDEDHLLVEIRDNGIGITASRERRDNRPSDHVSRGMKITEDRLALFATVTGKHYSLDIREIWNPDGTSGGTLVEMVLPQMES